MKRAIQPRQILLGGLHLFGLFGFAVAQPLFDLLGRYPQFLVAHQIQPMALLALTLALCAAVPLVLALIEAVASNWRPVYWTVHLTLLASLFGLFLLQLLARIGPPTQGAALVAVAALGGCAGAALYFSRSGVRGFLTWLSPTALLFPAIFLGLSPAAKLLFQSGTGESLRVTSRATVVMVVFDEFPALSLLDADGGIDARRFPHFAELAQDSYWFRNATTVSEGTLISVPAILDGLYPTPEHPRLPYLGDHPRNLFTMLSGSHRLHVNENVTQLAPRAAPATAPVGRRSSVPLLTGDLGVVYAHLALPADLASKWLPPVSESWTNFADWDNGGGKAAKASADSGERPGWNDFQADWSGRDRKFRDFVDSIRNDGEPALYFLHEMLPHASWRFLPDGRRYALSEPPGVRGVVGRNDRGIDVNQWRDVPWLTLQAEQRHLLQVGFVDTLVGELMEKLRSVGLYDQCLLIITADHGAAFAPGDARRIITESNYPEILWVPLFIKTPGQSQGRRDDRNVETIDILPTVAETLGVDLTWKVDGFSLLSKSFPARSSKIAFSDKGRKFVFNAESALAEPLARRIEKLGSGDWQRLYEVGEPRTLLRRQLTALKIVHAPPQTRIDLDGSQFFSRVALDSDFVPSLVRGRIKGIPPSDKPLSIAIAVNGTIEALTRTSPAMDDLEFTALVPPAAFRNGDNEVEPFLVPEGGHGRLLRVRSESRRFELKRDPKGVEFLVSSKGDRIVIRKDRLIGWVVGGLKESGDQLFVGGWAADRKALRPASSVAIFCDGRLLASGATRLPRADAVRFLGTEAARNSGFFFEAPLSALGADIGQVRVRVFAISRDGVASELNYPPPGVANWPFRR